MNENVYSRKKKMLRKVLLGTKGEKEEAAEDSPNRKCFYVFRLLGMFLRVYLGLNSKNVPVGKVIKNHQDSK